jgi:hypothetical protein
LIWGLVVPFVVWLVIYGRYGKYAWFSILK